MERESIKVKFPRFGGLAARAWQEKCLLFTRRCCALTEILPPDKKCELNKYFLWKTIFNHKTRYCKRIPNNFISAFASPKAIALGLEKCSSVEVSSRRKIPFGTKRQKAKGSFKYLQNKFFFSELAEKSKTSDVDTSEWIKLISRLRKTGDRNCRGCEKRKFHWKTGLDLNEIIPQLRRRSKYFPLNSTRLWSVDSVFQLWINFPSALFVCPFNFATADKNFASFASCFLRKHSTTPAYLVWLNKR